MVIIYRRMMAGILTHELDLNFWLTHRWFPSPCWRANHPCHGDRSPFTMAHLTNERPADEKPVSTREGGIFIVATVVISSIIAAIAFIINIALIIFITIIIIATNVYSYPHRCHYGHSFCSEYYNIAKHLNRGTRKNIASFTRNNVTRNNETTVYLIGVLPRSQEYFTYSLQWWPALSSVKGNNGIPTTICRFLVNLI